MRTTKPLKLEAAILGGILLLAAPAHADWGYDPTSMYDQKGLTKGRGFSIEAPHETIDPFSGALVLQHTDLMIPGVAGLDLALARVYSSKIHENYAARASNDPGRIARGMLFVPPSPLGLAGACTSAASSTRARSRTAPAPWIWKQGDTSN